MAVAVYPRLNALLQGRGISVFELKRAIEDRYAIAVDLATLQSLAGPGPINQTDLSLAGAVATVLEVSLDELFSIEAVPSDADTSFEDLYLTNVESKRLGELLLEQGQGRLDEHEANELGQLVETYGRMFRDDHLRRYAAKHGTSVDEAAEQADRRVFEASTWLQQLDEAPGGRQAFIRRVQQFRSSASR